MSIVKGLIRQMNGSIEVESSPGEGTTFTFRLPFRLAKEEANDAKADTASETGKELEGIHVLLVEDNEINMEIAEFLLRKEGAQVIRAWNGKEALECFEASAPGDISVILMDLVMPVMDGFQSAKAIRSLEREDASKVAIIALTASDYEEDAQKCRQAGMDEHLPKPLDAGNLIRVIQKYLR